jgi:hypothetical protein
VQGFIAEGKKVEFGLSLTDGEPEYKLKIEEEHK